MFNKSNKKETMKKHNVEIDLQDYLFTEKQIINKLNQISNTHTTELFIDDCIKGYENNFTKNFLVELQSISNSHNSLNIANSIDNQILNKQ
jgi:hypothetical protein